MASIRYESYSSLKRTIAVGTLGGQKDKRRYAIETHHGLSIGIPGWDLKPSD